MIPDGTKKTQRRLARLGYAYYTIGSAKASIMLKKIDKDIKDKKDIEISSEELDEIMWYFDRAI